MTTEAVAASVAANTGRAAPALSATSDMPVVAPADPSPPADAPLPDEGKNMLAKPGEGGDPPKPAEGDPAPADDKGKKDDTPPGVKAEITKERNRRRAAEERATAAEAKADEANKRAMEALDAVKALKPQQPDPSVAPRPKREDFDDPDRYDAALEQWTADRTAAAVRAEEQKKFEEKTASEKAEADKQARETEAKAVFEAWNDRVAKAVEEHPDFEEVVFKPAEDGGPTISEPMRDAILAADNGADVAYHLGKNVEDAKRIAALPPVKQLIEMGRLAAQLEAKAKPQPTKAPPPPSHLGGDNPVGPKNPAEMTMEEYAAQRQEKLRAQRQH